MEKKLTIKEAFDLAIFNQNKNDLKSAVNYYKEVLKINPDHLDSCLNLSVIALRTKEYETAKSLLTKVIKIDPKNVIAHNNLGVFFMNTKDYTKAEFLFKPLNQKDFKKS